MAPVHSGRPFNQPTQVALSQSGDIYVTDGYRNHNVHVFDTTGKYGFSWGLEGSMPGGFDLPHGVFVDCDDTVYVADRYNNRIQRFSHVGEWRGEWHGLIMPNAICRLSTGEFAVAELFQRVSVLDRNGVVISQFGDEGVVLDDSDPVRWGRNDSPARALGLRGIARAEPPPGGLCAPHGIAVDSRDSIFVAEVSKSRCGLADRQERNVQKFIRENE
jgi:DNA-binding beta-propeller fold protein YncE